MFGQQANFILGQEEIKRINRLELSLFTVDIAEVEGGKGHHRGGIANGRGDSLDKF